MARLRAFWRLPYKEKAIAFEAATVLVVVKIALMILPFKRVARRLSGVGAAPASSAARERHAARIGFLIGRSAAVLPFRCDCLPQAIAGKLMLRRRGIPSVLSIGVALDDRGFRAHAWLRCGSVIVTGAEGVEAFRVITDFSDGKIADHFFG